MACAVCCPAARITPSLRRHNTGVSWVDLGRRVYGASFMGGSDPLAVIESKEFHMTDTNTTAPKLTGFALLESKYNAAIAARDKAQVKVDELLAQINAVNALAAVTVGSTVIITVGKGDSAKDVASLVIGERENEDGTKTFKVTYGSGFDADVATVSSTKVKLPEPVAAEPQVEPAAE